MEIVIILGIVLALLFNFVNGLNDAANSIATVVATKVLSPFKAVLLASFFNLVGPLLFTTAIAQTIGRGIVDPILLNPQIILMAMVGAVIWVFFCSYFGIPVSSSHALIGGLLGAATACCGISAILWPSEMLVLKLLVMLVIGAVGGMAVAVYLATHFDEAWDRYLGLGALSGVAVLIPIMVGAGLLPLSGVLAVVVFMVVSPMLGFMVAYLFGIIIIRRFARSQSPILDHAFKKLQIVAAAFQAIGHGSNDAQNAMGIITAMLVAAGFLTEFEVPVWVILLSCTAISLGTLLGGWRVVDMMANKITKMQPYQGFCASAAGGTVLSVVTAFGVPVSTTHAMSGSIMGVGATKGYSAVKWGIVRDIVAAWVMTVPASAAVAWGCYLVFAPLLP
ncbi:inorganic phosphate transporter [Methanofollis formosanus]|uniref:Phosphate transporter n=1 Tax=Methanofollis formosanus TaxID=299308 RepID=A0A8G1A0U2_9EURY|nr:inorganic phosphate transporter [Methanofollis formosanus]QYZ78608.1 inorganic phosphate transporter [Methanofollis formosanus]